MKQAELAEKVIGNINSAAVMYSRLVLVVGPQLGGSFGKPGAELAPNRA